MEKIKLDLSSAEEAEESHKMLTSFSPEKDVSTFHVNCLTGRHSHGILTLIVSEKIIENIS